jgi:hypothetical protein
MRKFILATAIAALGAAVLASPAVAFDHHFTVLTKLKSFHEAGPSRFVEKEKLFDPDNHSSKVGRDRFKCHAFVNPLRVKCHGFIRLNGKVGGIGLIRLKGDAQPGELHVPVIGGTRQFNGVAGKNTILPTKHRKTRFDDRYHLDLVR